MRRSTIICLLLCVVLLSSCGGSASKNSRNSETLDTLYTPRYASGFEMFRHGKSTMIHIINPCLLYTSRQTRIDWNASYSYANKRQPDRRIVERQKDPSNGIDQYQIDQSFISRDFISLDEHIASAAANLSQPLNPSSENPIALRDGI